MKYDEDEKLIQLSERIEGIQKEQGYDEYEEREKVFEESWAAVQREERECEEEEVRKSMGNEILYERISNFDPLNFLTFSHSNSCFEHYS